MQLKYFCYMNSTGYSVAGQEYILSLLHVNPELNIKLQFFNVVTTTGVSPKRHELFTALSKKKDEYPQVNFYHCIPTRYKQPTNSQKNIGLCVFESINTPRHWVSSMNRMSSIVTCSEFNKRTFEANGVSVPIHVVPHCFDTTMFNKDVKPVGRYAKTTFLAIGTWRQRKNWELLIKGFYDAFEQKDNVCLLAKTDKPGELKKSVINIKQTSEWRTKDTAPIYAEEKVYPFEQIPEFMKKGDVYVSPSAGEGFGLPGLHAMALGIPIITTKFGGVLEYAKPNYCNYFEPKEYKAQQNMDGIPQFANCIWPVLKVSEISNKLRYVFENWPAEKIKDAYNYVHANYNYEVIGQKLLEVINA